MEPIPGRSLARSREYFARARKVIPSCTQTFSKGHTQFVQGVAPIFLERGRGSHVWDVDGNEYVDYVMALCPIVLGYDDPDVVAAVQRQLADGVTFSLAHPLEVEVAETLTKVVPCAEMVRFGKNGSDATSGAVRAARAYTGRDVIACCGYHGWQDWYIGTTTRSRGVPAPVRELTRTFTYNDLGSLERIFAEHPGRVAAVILEPVGVVEPEGDFLQCVATLTHAHGALLIFDEIFFSVTFGGEALSLAAARATIAKLREQNVIEHLWRQGTRLRDGYNALAREVGLASRTQCLGYPPRTVLTFSDVAGTPALAMKSLFQQEVIKRGILIAGGFNLCYAHSDDDIRRTLEACGDALAILARALAEDRVAARLEGPVIQPVFRSA